MITPCLPRLKSCSSRMVSACLAVNEIGAASPRRILPMDAGAVRAYAGHKMTNAPSSETRSSECTWTGAPRPASRAVRSIRRRALVAAREAEVFAEQIELVDRRGGRLGAKAGLVCLPVVGFALFQIHWPPRFWVMAGVIAAVLLVALAQPRSAAGPAGATRDIRRRWTQVTVGPRSSDRYRPRAGRALTGVHGARCRACRSVCCAW